MLYHMRATANDKWPKWYTQVSRLLLVSQVGGGATDSLQYTMNVVWLVETAPMLACVGLVWFPLLTSP
jgi:hypothetical protein